MITTTRFRNEQDYANMHRLIVENYQFSGLQLYPSIADLDYWRYIYDDSPENIYEAQLWEDPAGKLIGFVWMNAEATDLVCHYQHRACEEDMLAWAEEQYLQRYATPGVPDIHHVYVFDCDPERGSIALRRGYTKTEVYNYYGRRDLSQFIPPLDLAPDYRIRSIKTEDIARRAALNVLAGGEEISEEKYQRMMDLALSYRQELDLVAIGPDGTVAAFCTVWLDEQSGCGIVEPFGCDPGHRRKKMGKNLLYEGMRRLKTMGARSVYVTHAGCEGDEMDAALELNRAVGFERIGKNYLWQKVLPAKTHATLPSVPQP